MGAKLRLGLIIGSFAIWSINLCIAESDVPLIQWGCPLPKLDNDFCQNKEKKIECNITTDCFIDFGEAICCGGNCKSRICYIEEAKPGECPFGPTNAALCGKSNPDIQCGVDKDCPGIKKCCFEGCKGSRCVDPKGPDKKRFGCPFEPKTLSAKKCDKLRKKTNLHCLHDGDCPKKKTCCQSSCGISVCTKVKQRKGICRKVGPVKRLCNPPDKDLCGTDFDCPAPNKCCPTECGGSKCNGECVDNPSWRGTVKSEHNECIDCSCKQLNGQKAGVLLDLACLNNVNKILDVQTGCCKSCEPYHGFTDLGF